MRSLQTSADSVAAFEQTAAELRALLDGPRRLAAAMTLAEIRALDNGLRLVAYFRSQMHAVAAWLRANPRADAILGVLLAVYALADAFSLNGVVTGYCSIEQERLGRLFGRSRRHINSCLHELAVCGLVDIETIKGAPSRVRPIVPGIFAQDWQPRWFFDALAPRVEHAKPGRKPKLPENGAFSGISEIGGNEAFSGNGKYLRTKIEIDENDAFSQNLPFKSPDDEEQNAHRARKGVVSSNLTDDDNALHFAVMNAFSRAPGYLATADSPVMPKPSADANLASRFSGWTQAAPAEIVLQCLRSVLAEMQLRAHDPDRTKLCRPTLSGFAGYLTKCMDEALPKTIAAATKVAGQQAVEQSRVKTQDAIGAKQEAAVDRSIASTERKRAAAGNVKRLAKSMSDEQRRELEQLQEEYGA
jgi:hypothetical protein